MLNRRILRIKAMQTLYSYVQCQKSNYQLAIDQIAGDFLPDLNSMEPQDPVKLAAERETATKLFKNSYKAGSVISEEPIAPKVMRSVAAALNFYKVQVQKDYQFLSKGMVREAEGIFDHYLKSLQLLVEFGDLARHDMEEKSRKKGVELAYEAKLVDNLLVDRLRRHELFKSESIRRNVRLDPDQLRQWYKLLVKDQVYLDYRELAERTDEKDIEIVNHILRNFIFANEELTAFFEEEDINWTEDRTIVRSMAGKTLKALAEAENVALHELSANWEDDRVFFEQLFQYTVEEDALSEVLIGERTQNWDINRITAVDRIILGMAISEMLHFSSIPVKVSINEYIELSKEYSTPRSYNFVNGLLNSISESLSGEGKIRKSGRGLIDNK